MPLDNSILSEISHRRFNPLRGTWLLVSPHRNKRPWQGQQETMALSELSEYDSKCYLCPGNIRAQSDNITTKSNPDYSKLFVFINDFSAVKAVTDPPAWDPAGPGHGGDGGNGSSTTVAERLLQALPVTGACYVMTFSRKHNVTLADMSPREVLLVVETWTRLYAMLVAGTGTRHRLPAGHSARPVSATDCLGTLSEEVMRLPFPPGPPEQLMYMQIFENKGSAMGCSNPHPHCQVWATSMIPEEPAAELLRMIRYRADQTNHGRHLLQDYVKLELEKQERLVWQNDDFAVICPWWAVWPYEVLVLPKQHVASLLELSSRGREQFAAAICEVTRRYDNLFCCHFPYSSGIHQAPLDGTAEEIDSSYLHMHFYPPLLRSATVKKFFVGFELMAEPQRDITPEQAAATLRQCGGPLYRMAGRQ